MLVIEELTDDDGVYVIKWFDRFRLPHAGTRSASVDVLFQRLPVRNAKELNQLDETTVQAIVGKRDDAPAQSAAGAYRSVPLLAGYIPHLRIGGVYRAGEYIGQLPGSRRHIDLPHESQLTSASIGDRLAAPAGWSKNLAYRLMTAKQYELRFALFSRSKCLYFLDRASSTEYVIPRAVIFRTFYASHSLLANAFTSGPWAQTAENLISESSFRSGLKTQADPIAETWDLVLTPTVPEDDLAHILALLWFEPYARKCADNIYSAMLQDSGDNVDHVWFASAEIPFRPDSSTLALDVRGFNLLPRTPYFAPGSEVPHHTFLVTSITSFPWPAYALPVRWEKTNSGAQGGTKTTDPGSRPYSGVQRSEPAGGEVRLTSSTDGSPRYSRLESAEDRISIVGAPPLEKILKQSSIHYEGSGRPAQEDEDGPKASSGNPSHGVDAQQQIHHSAVVRSAISSFAGLLDAVKSLTMGEDPLRVSYSVVQPEGSPPVTLAIGEPCWDFLSDAEHLPGCFPRFGWKVVREHKQRVPRVALILHITLQDQDGYWIEIEPRTSNDAMCSPFIVDVTGDTQETLRAALAVIAEQCGHHLQLPLEGALDVTGSGGRVRCFRHRYTVKDGSATWNVRALKAFLTGAFNPAEPHAEADHTE